MLSEHRYRILMAGELSAAAREEFDGWRLEPVGTETALIGDMDQAALHGVLNRIRGFGLHLVEVRRLRPTPATRAQ
jgi:hypothetical protein